MGDEMPLKIKEDSITTLAFILDQCVNLCSDERVEQNREYYCGTHSLYLISFVDSGFEI